MKIAKILIAAACLAIAIPAHAEIVESEHGGFASTHSVLVARDRAEVWQALVHPEDWWSHSMVRQLGQLAARSARGRVLLRNTPRR